MSRPGAASTASGGARKASLPFTPQFRHFSIPPCGNKVDCPSLHWRRPAPRDATATRTLPFPCRFRHFSIPPAYPRWSPATAPVPPLSLATASRARGRPSPRRNSRTSSPLYRPGGSRMPSRGPAGVPGRASATPPDSVPGPLPPCPATVLPMSRPGAASNDAGPVRGGELPFPCRFRHFPRPP